jgi:hypothetical protein
VARRVYLHIGTPKSGTSYLQEVLWSNRRELARRGLLYPAWAADAHFLACQDLQGTGFNDWTHPEVPGSWGRLVRRVHRTSGTAVISHELFGDASAEVAARAIDDLAPADVHLVVTLRDLGRVLPAVWQEDVKNMHPMGFGTFLDAVNPDTDTHNWVTDEFWRRHDVPAVLSRWGAVLPADRIHLVTAPPSGSAPDELWRRFATVLGVDPCHAVLPVGALNRSLGAVETELLRQVNLRLAGRGSWPRYTERVTHYLAPEVLGPRRGRPVHLPTEDHAWVSRLAERSIAELRNAGHHVVGDFQDLTVPERPATQDVPVDPQPAELLDAALDALAGLVAAEEFVPHRSLADRLVWRALRVLDRRPARRNRAR